MDQDSAFRSYLEGGLSLFGIEADETERAVMQGVFSVYQPGIEQILALDLTGVEEERPLDLGRAPES